MQLQSIERPKKLLFSVSTNQLFRAKPQCLLLLIISLTSLNLYIPNSIVAFSFSYIKTYLKLFLSAIQGLHCCVILMNKPLEHNYIGLTEASSMERSSDKISSPPSSALFTTEDEKNSAYNLKETELRLGLPGSESPERKPGLGISLFGKDLEEKKNGYSQNSSKNVVSGAKRGFSDTIDVSSEKWVFSVGNGSESDSGKSAVLFSPRGGNGVKLLSGQESKKDVSVAQSSKQVYEKKAEASEHNSAPAAKAQVVGWPPIRSFRKNTMASNSAKNNDDVEGKAGICCLYVKVSMDGAPYLRKVDLKTYINYTDLSLALEKMFSCFTIGRCGSHGLPERDGLSESRLMDLLNGSEYVLTYEDKDADWMLVGDVPWEMFTDSCRRLRIMKGSEAIGLAPRAVEKCKKRN